MKRMQKPISFLLSLLMLLSVCSAAAFAEDVRPITTETVSYLDETGEEKTVEAGIIESGGQPYGVRGETNWYILKGTSSVSGQILFYDAQANIILADDADWTVSANFITIYGSMNFYAQENGTGKLTLNGNENRILTQNGGDMKIYGGEITTYAVHADYDHNGTLSIYGGKVNSNMMFGYDVNIYGGEAKGVVSNVRGAFKMTGGKLDAIAGSSGPGLGIEAGTSIEITGGTVFAKGTIGLYSSTGSITITGGTVTAEASNSGIFGISAKNVTITGGNVTAHKGSAYGVYASDTLTLGADVPNTSITADNMNAVQNLVIKEGQTLSDGENDYTGTLNAEQVEALSGKTLTCKHSYDVQSWTYADEGRHARVCETCGGTLEYEDHDVIVRGAGDATCTAEGYTGDEFCSVCGEKLSEGQIIPAKGHTEGDPVAENVIQATCTEDGSYEVVTYCADCGVELHRVPKTEKAFGHITEVVGAKEATANEDGYTGDEVCTVCGETVKAGEVIPAAGESAPDEPTAPKGGCPLCGEDHTGHNGIKAIHYVMYFLRYLFTEFLPIILKFSK